MESIPQRYADQIAGTLSCFDRIVVTGTLPEICHKTAITKHLYSKGIRVFDYAKGFAEPLRDEIRTNAEVVAKNAGLQIEFVRSSHGTRKEDLVQRILAQRPEDQRDQPGLVHILSAMEPCNAFVPWHDKATQKTFLRPTQGKCLHYYFYFIDPEFGLCHLRVPTWCPFRLQFCCNGHNWLAHQLRQRSVDYRQLDNTFSSIADWTLAQELADTFPVERFHRGLDQAATRFCPVLRHFQAGYHWSIMQVEYSTDIVFQRQADLRPLYDALVHTAIHAVKADNIATFLGRKLHPLFQDEAGNDFHVRIEGTRIKHKFGSASLKMYDKAGLVLRLETTSNDVSFFKHYREVEHRNGETEKKLAPVQKTIYSLGVMRELLAASNRRYLNFLSDLSDPSPGLKKIEDLSQTVRQDNRTYRGFNLFDSDDLALCRSLARGEWQISGFTNTALRQHLPGKTGSQISRLFKRLHVHGLIKKVGHTYKYYLTSFGQEVVLSALKLRELVLIPSLAAAPT